ncbi:MCE family protein [Pseudomonas sp. LTJR-52]|uniref:PqiB family protein n=1 Tax=Pseudomonas sp. LTJR-52 TaxID=2479392 RepID=UPI000EFD0026|nr:MlaD family protein [Pseudomonas sp. LTJR-52]AYN94653.1 MCE family protein [Pseudomonas sp. LTJR-52]
MSNNPNTAFPTPGTPQIRKRRFSISLVWLVPIVAALIGLSMVVNSWLRAGPQVNVSFQTAEGLEANKTQVKYKNVVIGTVTRIALSEDRTHVTATIDLDKSAEPFTREDTQYWVVRPRIGANGVSGVDTLLSGPFIGADAGRSEVTKKDFVGLENPPPVTYGQRGKRFTLHTDDLGSLDIGSPVYYRRIQVGQVISYNLTEDGKGVDVQVFVNSPNDAFVTDDTRFWNASGIDVSVDASGLKVNTQTIPSILAGGIAFREPNYSPDAKPAPEHYEFTLYNDQQTALAPPSGEPRFIRLRFNQSLRGLAVNAPVEFLGVNIGRVVSVDLDYDPKTQRFPTTVGAVVYPQRLGSAHDKLVKQIGGESEEQSAQLIKRLVEQGLRAQARTGNLLTGQLYIALDFDPKAAKVSFNPNSRPLEIPTVPGGFDKLQEQLQAMVDKISKLPIDSIANNLNGSLNELQKTMKQVNGDVLPQMRGTLEELQNTLKTANETLDEDSPARQQVNQAMDEVQRTARSVRVLTDYLSRHPESLIRGRTEEAAPGSYNGKSSSRDIEMESQP